MEAIEQENEEFTATPPEIREQAIKATDNLLPEKSRIQYERAYNLFSKWCSEKQIKIYSENVLVAYFQQHSENILPEASKPLLGKIKSNGTDDGFKGEAAQCGSSVIRVAHQMVTGKFTKGTVTSEEEFATEPANFNRALRRVG
ncbi:scy1-related s/t protein kinase-like [Holotrichia oblita]|uniref:Scy1-related s/t protein kinase-like n=1 Tax=Holotrichia oblita TaxID=644536 RepID=A0ACB9SY41_HOLOL|nr:scy1-related s/t protein kinase-like [Holotrichia oblita]